jgi:hypothetical protein
MLDVPLYTFLKEPLVRRYGIEWYEKLLLNLNENQCIRCMYIANNPSLPPKLQATKNHQGFLFI